MKDEISLLNCEKLEDVNLVIDDYISYYNNKRRQWTLCKMTPNQYDQYRRSGKLLKKRVS
jgi:hypothetical protein